MLSITRIPPCTVYSPHCTPVKCRSNANAAQACQYARSATAPTIAGVTGVQRRAIGSERRRLEPLCKDEAGGPLQRAQSRCGCGSGCCPSSQGRIPLRPIPLRPIPLRPIPLCGSGCCPSSQGRIQQRALARVGAASPNRSRIGPSHGPDPPCRAGYKAARDYRGAWMPVPCGILCIGGVPCRDGIPCHMIREPKHMQRSVGCAKLTLRTSPLLTSLS
jgi:hypothetical protein